MGLLVEGKALTPEEMKSKLKELRYHGITQFLNIWNSIKDRSGDQLKFGDEIEAGIFILDHSKKTIKLSLRSAEV